MKNYVCNRCTGLEDSPPKCIVLDTGWGKPTRCPMDGTAMCDFKEEKNIALTSILKTN